MRSWWSSFLRTLFYVGTARAMRGMIAILMIRPFDQGCTMIIDQGRGSKGELSTAYTRAESPLRKESSTIAPSGILAAP